MLLLVLRNVIHQTHAKQLEMSGPDMPFIACRTCNSLSISFCPPQDPGSRPPAFQCSRQPIPILHYTQAGRDRQSPTPLSLNSGTENQAGCGAAEVCRVCLCRSRSKLVSMLFLFPQQRPTHLDASLSLRNAKRATSRHLE